MARTYKKGQKTYRLAPCPAYDVEGMESWLSDMAEKGLFLAKDGFFAGIARFEYDTPRRAIYRLEAAQKSTSMWSENGGDPDPEHVELAEKYSWTYVGKRGNFHIYRSFEPVKRELHTDPEVQAMALSSVKKRQLGALCSAVFWSILYPLFLFRGGLVLTMVTIRTWVFLLASLVVLMIIADSVLALISLSRLQKKLLYNGQPEYENKRRNWRKGTVRHWGKRLIQAALAVTVICLLLNVWGRHILYEDRVSLDSYSGEIPFATISDFAGPGSSDYRNTMSAVMVGSVNTVMEWSDWLAPRCIDYNEHAQITLSDGNVLKGGLYVEYFETVSPWVARLIAKDGIRIDRWRR